MKIGDLVRNKFDPAKLGVITKVYDSPIKITVEVSWFGDSGIYNSGAIEPYYLEKVS